MSAGVANGLISAARHFRRLSIRLLSRTEKLAPNKARARKRTQSCQLSCRWRDSSLSSSSTSRIIRVASPIRRHFTSRPYSVIVLRPLLASGGQSVEIEHSEYHQSN